MAGQTEGQTQSHLSLVPVQYSVQRQGLEPRRGHRSEMPSWKGWCWSCPFPKLEGRAGHGLWVGKEDEEKPLKLRQHQRLGQEKVLIPSFTPFVWTDLKIAPFSATRPDSASQAPTCLFSLSSFKAREIHSLLWSPVFTSLNAIIRKYP